MMRVASGSFRNTPGAAHPKHPSFFRSLVAVVALGAALLLSACESRDHRAAEASARFAQAFAAGDYPAARIAISEALAARDDVARYWIDLGRTEAALNQYEQAFAAYQRALELEPNNLEALQNMAEMQVLQRDFRRAERTAAQIMRISPGDPRALLVSGYIALARGQGEAALATAERVLARYPGDESGLLLKARALAQLQRGPEAIQLLENSLRVTGSTRPKLDALREFYTAANDWPGLARSFERLLELAPADASLRLDSRVPRSPRATRREAMRRLLRCSGCARSHRPCSRTWATSSSRIAA